MVADNRYGELEVLENRADSTVVSFVENASTVVVVKLFSASILKLMV